MFLIKEGTFEWGGGGRGGGGRNILVGVDTMEDTMYFIMYFNSFYLHFK